MTTPTATIRLENVSKTFGAAPHQEYALRDVNMVANPGEILLFMGPSGSGKTTLLSIIGCILQPSSGSVQVAGNEVVGLSGRGLSRVRLDHIGFIFQEYNLFPMLTAHQNVMVALDLAGYRANEADHMAQHALETVGLADKRNVHPGLLSGGQKQRLAVARALAGQPEIILADEPTAALDSTNGQIVMELLRDLAHEQDRTVIIVTHDGRIKKFADRVVRIEDGLISGDTNVNSM